jgi:hypothetical protein
MMSAERFPPDTPTGLRLANAERRLGVWARRARLSLRSLSIFAPGLADVGADTMPGR